MDGTPETACPEPAPTPDKEQAVAPGGQETILIIDDTPNNLRLLSMMLIERGYKVRAVINGPMGLKSAHLERPDIILLDICMPEMDGYTVCEQLKADTQTSDIPVIFISALDEAIDKVKAFAVGGIDYITKPFQVEEVLVRIKNQLMLRHLQRQLEYRIEELQSLTLRLQNELQLARNIQKGFLPPTRPEWDDLDVVCYSEPAHEVGGDLYIYHRFPLVQEDCPMTRYVFAVGDVSGTGMPAALLMSASVASFRSLVEHNLSPAAFLEQMNYAIADYTCATGLNCAFVYGEIDYLSPSGVSALGGAGKSGGRVMRLINAGGVYPLLKRSNGLVEWVDIRGLPLGVKLNPPRNNSEISLWFEKGDILILTSDGVIEAKNAAGEMFGFERLEASIRRGPQESAEAMLNSLRAEIATFVGETEPHDDITIVVVRGGYAPCSSENQFHHTGTMRFAAG